MKVTFWDAFVELFAEALKEEYEYPLIIIVGGATIQERNGMYETTPRNIYIRPNSKKWLMFYF